MAQSTPGALDPDPVEVARNFLGAGLWFATIATIGPDGAPHQAVAWYLLRDDVLVLNSADGRAWPANLRRDPRVSVTVEDGYRWLSMRGKVDVNDDQRIAQADIAAMARHYHADEPGRAEAMIRDRFERQARVSFRLALADSRLHYEE
jgi:PPOX class probable F420-dependent enzyme